MTAAAPMLRPDRRRLFRRLAVGLLLLVALAAAAALSPAGRAAIAAWAKERGFHRFDRSRDFAAALAEAPGRWWRSARVPHLHLEVKPRHWRELAAMRQRALQKGVLEESEQTSVPARLAHAGRVLDVELRLKGDFTDHLQGQKWSFRVEVPDDAEVLGLRRFSLQDPRTKGFHGEALYFATLQQLGVLAPRYEFVTVQVGPLDCGVMALEEHVGPELLLRQGRPDGPVVHFDEAMVFFGRDDYREVDVVPFAPKRWQRDEAARATAAAAVAALRAFVDGERPLAAVFDVERLAAQWAAATFWGSWHALRWHNLRFAYDPARGRLEPIGFDGNLHMQRRLPAAVGKEEGLSQRLLQDAGFRAAFLRQLHALAAMAGDGRLAALLDRVEAAALPALDREFWLLDRYSRADLAERGRCFAALRDADLPTQADGALATRAWWHPAGGGVDVVVHRAPNGPWQVGALHWVTRDGSGRRAPFVGREPLQLPRAMRPDEWLRWRGLPPPGLAFAALEMELLFTGGRLVQRVPRAEPPPSAPAAVRGR